jgi:hypothetical protein
MKTILLICLGLLMIGCTSTTSSNDDNQQPQTVLRLSVEAQPSSITADGISHMVIFTEFFKNNQPIEDSSEVILLNTIGTLGSGRLYTHAGIALDTLRSDTTAGMGWIIAYAQGIRDSAEIMFTARP